MPTPAPLSAAALSFNPDTHLKESIEQACAPGLGLSERFHKLTASVFIPDLLPNEQELAANLTNAQRKMLALDRFKNTPQYQSFRNVINHTLAELDTIANTTRPQAQKNTNFQGLASGLWETVNPNTTSRFGVFQADLYQQACPDANRLVRMHAFARQRPDLVASGGEDNARAGIKELSERLNVCGPGIVQHFEEAAHSVRQATFTPSMPERFEALRIQIARNAIAEFVHENPDPQVHGPGNEIHKVAAWQNHFAASMNLPVINDVYASPQYAANHFERMGLSRRLDNLQPKPAVAKAMAFQILQEAHDSWNQLQTDGVSDLAQGCMTILDKISSRHGPVAPHALFDMNEDGMPFKIHDNPTLLALSILQQVKGKVTVVPGSPKIVRWPFYHQNEESTLTLKSQLHLSWIETAPPAGMGGKPENQLVSARHLGKEQLGQLLDLLNTFQIHDVPFKSAMHELLRNDWGQHLEPLRSHNFDSGVPNDVFIHLAMGLAHGLKLGEVETHPKLLAVFSTAIANLHSSRVLKHYSPDQIVKCLNHAHQLTDADGRLDPFGVYRKINTICNLQPTNVDISLYKAALEFKWNNEPQKSLDEALGNPAFATTKSAYGVAYVDVMAKCAPHCLNVTLLDNINIMAQPEVAVRFIDVGATFTATNYGQPSAQQRLLLHPNDAFVTIVLNQLSERGVSLQEVARPDVIAMLTRRGMSMAAATLRNYPGR